MANVLSIVSYNILPASLGGQKGIHLFNKYLGETHNIICVTIKNNDASKAEGYTMLPILTNSKTRYLNIFYFFKFRNLIKKYKISHIILEHPYFGWLGVLLKLFCGIQLIVHSHNIEAHRFKSLGNWWWRLVWFYEKWTHRLADATFNISPEDRQYMIEQFHMKPEKCTVITYGIERDHPPAFTERSEAKNILCEKYSIPANTILYFYNGTLNYLPNLKGVDAIIYDIIPKFKSENPYKIIICGKDLPAEYNNLENYSAQHVIYAGFVNDINLYFTGTDIFINPVTVGAGIKTKLVEALGHDLTAVSSKNGAFGVETEKCNGKLMVVDNDDWQGFADEMVVAQKITTHVDERFYSHFTWREIGLKAARVIEEMKK